MEQILSDQDIELLSQYLDGELAPTLSRALEARLHNEAALQSGLLRMQELNQRLRDALAEHDAIPQAVQALLHDTSAVDGTDSGVAFGATVLAFPGRTPAPAVAAKVAAKPVWMYALAASFVGAIALSLVTDLSQSPQSRLPGNDGLVTAALDELPSGNGWAELSDGREIQPVLSFPHEDGRWCREYLLRGGESDWRAVACKEQSSWVTQAAGLESYLDPSDTYRPAGASDSAPVASFISQHAGDIALGRDDEIALIDRNWQN
ncbi:hypothetical protein R0135_00470 [Congregibacter variabilis]|uniref:Uncharacterized protein n=1 Tax=Congregibacter variabilis TaxID=3081200 RepID=A0ABZ0I2C7_9GAMM|nr:hypothetical protein R0135_00470 [Congregibacter sp. IMCC43200]